MRSKCQDLRDTLPDGALRVICGQQPRMCALAPMRLGSVSSRRNTWSSRSRASAVIEPGIQILVHPSGALHGNKIVEADPCLLNFRPDLLRPIEVCRSEPLRAVRRILMDPVHQIAIDDHRKRCISERALLDAITGRSETGDIRRKKQPARDENSRASASAVTGRAGRSSDRADQTAERRQTSRQPHRGFAHPRRRHSPMELLTLSTAPALAPRVAGSGQ